MQGGCLWVVPGEMKVGVFLLLVYRVSSSGQSSRMLSLGVLCRSYR